MSQPLPLKRKEGERLELKSREVLREPEKIARAAVAMLNANGGEVWVGIRETPGDNVVEAIEDAERERTRLQDRLLDLIEPRPIHQEVTVTVEGAGPGGPVLRVALHPDRRRHPYALLGPRGGRYFLRRFDNRTISMTREDIGKSFRQLQAPEAESGVAETLRGEATRLLNRSDARCFLLLLQPEGNGELKLQRLALTDLLSDPTLSGTPRGSYNYSAAFYHGAAVAERHHGQSWLHVGNGSLGLRLSRGGGMRFESAMENLFGGVLDPSGKLLPSTQLLLAPEALLGYTISTLRLAGRLLEEDDLWDRPPAGPLWASLVMTGLEGCALLPGLGTLEFGWSRKIERHRYTDQAFLEEPLALSLEDVRKRPDACGVRLLWPVYWSFGLSREDEMPAIQSVGLGSPRL
jgi:hypothetical protein